MRCIDAEGEMNGKYQYYRMKAAGKRKREGKRQKSKFSETTQITPRSHKVTQSQTAEDRVK